MHSVVAAEHLGLARQFRARFEASDPATSVLIDRLVLPLRQRAERHPVPRTEMLAGVAREWRTLLPAHGRLSLSIAQRHTKLAISEVRVSASLYRRGDWHETERGVTVLHMRVIVAPHVFEATSRALAAVSLHALARRHQKAFDVTDDAIFADLRALADAYTALAGQPVRSPFRVDSHGGAWVGHVARIVGELDVVLNTRTYLAEDEAARQFAVGQRTAAA